MDELDGELVAQAKTLDLLGVENGDGTAFLLNQNTVLVDGTESLAQRLSGITADFKDANARIDEEEIARADEDEALSGRITSMFLA